MNKDPEIKDEPILEGSNPEETAPAAEETAPTAEETAPAAEPTVEEQLEKAQQEIASVQDQLLRKIAEFDNYRRRTIKEKTELILNGGEKMIVAVLPVIDDLERALKNNTTNEETEAMRQGVELIYKKFMHILEKEGVKPIDTTNADFNVDLHEAIAQLPAPSDELKGKVMDCTLTGYTLNDKVIRHAQVVVAL